MCILYAPPQRRKTKMFNMRVKILIKTHWLTTHQKFKYT